MKTILLIIVGIIAFVLLNYFIWAVFIPMRVGERAVEREITEQSQQYVKTQRAALVNLYANYNDTDDSARKTAIRNQMCQIAAEIPKSEVPDYIRSLVTSCR